MYPFRIFSAVVSLLLLLAHLIVLTACSSLPNKEETIHIIPSADRSHVDVKTMVNGQPLVFKLDTGAVDNLVNTATGLEDLIAQGSKVNRKNFVGTESVVSFTAKTIIDELQVRNLTYHYSPENKSNLLSTSSYISKRMLFDFKRNVIYLGGNEQPCIPTQKFRILRKSIFLISLSFGSHKGWFLWDTGASNSYVDLKWAKENWILRNFSKDFNVNAGNRMSQNVSSYAELKTNFDGVNISGIFPAIDLAGLEQLSSDIKGIIGANLIFQKNWYFDLESKKLCLFN